MLSFTGVSAPTGALRAPALQLASDLGRCTRLSGSSSVFATGTRPQFILRCVPVRDNSTQAKPSTHRNIATTTKMELSRAVIAGGSGFIGSRIAQTLVDRGVEVTILSRSKSSTSHLPSDVKTVIWPASTSTSSSTEWKSTLEGVDTVINLSGAPVVSRWTESGKKDIVNSRLDSTTALTEAILDMDPEKRPKSMVSTSAVGYYGISDAARFTEDSSPAENDFLADLSVKWEQAAQPVVDAGVRLTILRVGVVLGVGGGALARMIPAFKLFVGGPVGSGTQWVSWVHIDDIVNMFITAASNDNVSGVYNATAPTPVTMGDLSASLAKALNRPNLFPVPGIALKAMFGDGASVVLNGQQVVPDRWLREDFKFAYPTIDAAMAAVAKEA